MFYLTSIYQGTKLFKNSIRYRWLRPGQTTLWEAEQAILAHPDNNDLLYSTVNRGSGNPKRHKTAEEKDFFISNGYPRTAVNPENGHIYLVFADLPSAGSTTDRGDIFAIEGTPNAADDSLTWSTVVRVNNDATETDQWNPDVTVNPSGTKLFVGYYSRQEDPDTNKWIRAYGAKADIANGLVGATFDMIPISAKFEPLFAGTTNSTPVTNTWMYDHVWAQKGICLDNNARVVSLTFLMNGTVLMIRKAFRKALSTPR